MLLVKSFIRIWVWIFLLVSVFSCSSGKKSSDDLITIDVEKAYNEPTQKIMMSEMVQDIEYVKLETQPGCLIGKTASLAVSENFITIYDSQSKRILLFAKNGEYLHDIGNVGKGPGEYTNIVRNSLAITPDEKYVVVRVSPGGNTFLYNIDGSFKGSWPDYDGSLDAIGILAPSQIVTSLSTRYLPQEGGSLVKIYDENFNVIDSLFHSEYSPIEWKNGPAFVINNLTCRRDEIFFRHDLNDTVFKVNSAKKISPYIITYLGTYEMPSIIVPSAEFNINYLRINKIIISDNFISLTFRAKSRDIKRPGSVLEILVYNKETKEAFFLSNHEDSFKGQGQNSIMPVNNLDGLLDPDISLSINDKFAEGIDIIDAKSFLESDSFDPSKLPTDKYYREVKKILDESDIEDNPIIRICYLK